MAKQELTQAFKTEGAEAAVSKINALEKAQRDLIRAEEDLRRAAANPYNVGGELDVHRAAVVRARIELSELENQVDETKFSTDAFASLLSQFSPVLGAVAQGASNAAKSIGKLATKQIDANSVMAAAKKGAGEYAGTIQLLGAAGIALLSLRQIKKAWDAINEAEEKAISNATKFRESQSGIEDKKEAVRAGVVDTFAKTRPSATADEVQIAVDNAFREVNDLGAGVSGAVARATGTAAPLSEREADFRRQFAGPGVRRDEARAQLQSFNTTESFITSNLTGRGRAVDSGPQAALLKTIEELFGETGEAAQKRIAEAQRLLGHQTGRLAEPGFIDFALSTQEGNDARAADEQIGRELLRALKLTAEHLERSAKANAETEIRESRKTPPTGTVPPRIEPGIG